MNDTLRGVIIFASVLLTLGLWAPLRNQPERLATGVIVTETYFGAFRYATLRAELKEPDYAMKFMPNYRRLGLTVVVTAGLWTGVVLGTRRKKSSGDRSEA